VELEAPPANPEPLGPLDFVTMADILDALDQLKPSDREIFTLANVHHLSYREISGRLGIPINTAGTRLRRVRAKLRRLLTRVHAIRERTMA
jgi:RNA polymerase sigma factor (sigma-70 family)